MESTLEISDLNSASIDYRECNRLQRENHAHKQVSMYEMVRKRMEGNAFTLANVSQIQPNTILIDDRVMWYGSLTPFGFSKETDNIMRVESPF